MGSLSIWHWLIVLIVVVLIFGTKKLKNVGKDVGGAVKGFKEGLQEATEEFKEAEKQETTNLKDNTLKTDEVSKVIDVQAKEK